MLNLLQSESSPTFLRTFAITFSNLVLFFIFEHTRAIFLIMTPHFQSVYHIILRRLFPKNGLVFLLLEGHMLYHVLFHFLSNLYPRSLRTYGQSSGGHAGRRLLKILLQCRRNFCFNLDPIHLRGARIKHALGALIALHLVVCQLGCSHSLQRVVWALLSGLGLIPIPVNVVALQGQYLAVAISILIQLTLHHLLRNPEAVLKLHDLLAVLLILLLVIIRLNVDFLNRLQFQFALGRNRKRNTLHFLNLLQDYDSLLFHEHVVGARLD